MNVILNIYLSYIHIISTTYVIVYFVLYIYFLLVPPYPIAIDSTRYYNNGLKNLVMYIYIMNERVFLIYIINCIGYCVLCALRTLSMCTSIYHGHTLDSLLQVCLFEIIPQSFSCHRTCFLYIILVRDLVWAMLFQYLYRSCLAV